MVAEVNRAAMSEPSFTKPPDRALAGTSAGTSQATAETTSQATSRAAPETAPEATIDVTVNGESRRIAAGTTVAALLAELGLADRRVAVERNRQVVPRAEHARAVLAAGDHLEVVTFVGGGQ
jgi:sulfur carrier protein